MGDTLGELLGDASAPRLNRRATGLFHLALLLPSRHELAVALARVGRARWPLEGASDHLVSEAVYLSDPDGNGIELYRDRPWVTCTFKSPSCAAPRPSTTTCSASTWSRGAVGLRSFDVVLPDEPAREQVLDRLRAAGVTIEDSAHGPMVRDPSGNAVVLRVASGAC